MLFRTRKTLAHFQKMVSGTVRPIVRGCVDETAKIVLFHKRETLAHSQKWISAMLNLDFETSVNPDTFDVTSGAWNFMGAASQHVEDISSESDLTAHAKSAGSGTRGGNTTAVPSGVAGGPEALPRIF